MKKIIAIDLDGTLLDDDLRISYETVNELRLAKKYNYEIVICTGRPLASAKIFTDIINKKEPIIRYLVLLNGSSIYDLKINKIIKSYNLNSNVINKAVDYLNKYKNENINLVAMNNNEFLTVSNIELSDETIEDARKNFMNVNKINEYELSKKYDINKIFFISDKNTMNELEEELYCLFNHDSNVVRSSDLIYEILHKDTDKGKGLEVLSNILHIDKKNIVCIGDELNDLPMFDISGTKIAMKNGNPILKNKADFITKDNNNSGVAYALKKYLNIV